MQIASFFLLLLSFFQVSVATAAPSQGFVRREGARLMLDGASFYFSGANQYYLFYKSQAMTNEVLEDAAALGMNVVRTWAFCDGEWHDGHSLQPSPRVYNEESFKNLDYAIYRAEQLGIRLVFSLVNNWDAFGGMNTYVKWAGSSGGHDDFYSNGTTRALFKDYISYVLNRKNTYTGRAYKDEPGILMWELANEPRAARSRSRELHAWIHEMAGHIKSIDANHLVSTGSEGDIDGDLTLAHQSPHIDVVSFHLYPEDWGLSEQRAMDYIGRNIKIAKERLGKPVFCGEFGIRNKGRRDQIYRSWYRSFQSQGIDGALLWILSGHQDQGGLYPDYDGFTVYYPESETTVPVIQDHSQWVRQSSGKLLDTLPPMLMVNTVKDGEIVQGVVEFEGIARDEHGVKSVSVNFGGVDRPASLVGDTWHFSWDSHEALDGKVTMTVVARDAEDNPSSTTLTLEVANQGYREGIWDVTGEKGQDDGFNLVYSVAAKNLSDATQKGRFVARFYLLSDGPARLGTHYENSQVYQENPAVSELRDYFGSVQYFEVDLGFRSVGPGEFIGFKGQITQPDGSMNTDNDWSAGDLPGTNGHIRRVVWLMDGKVIAGQAP